MSQRKMRAGQLVSPFGTGAVIDQGGESFACMDVSKWPQGDCPVIPNNTFDAHRLVHFANTQGLGDAMKERLFRAYFEQGQLMSDHEVLVTCATEVGLDETATREVLASGTYADEVRFDEAQARDNDFSAVPTFVVDGRFAVSGAQDPEVLMKMIERARATA